MISRNAGERLLQAFPPLAELNAAAWRDVLEESRELSIQSGTLVFEPGQACQTYLLIRSGSVRVHLLDAERHEIVLYRLGRGNTCILTTAALLGATPYAAYAVTETNTEATTIPAKVFDRLLSDQAAFRRFVFVSHADRIADLMRVMSEIAFTRIQVRLARCLLEQSDTAGSVKLTHKAIAIEIGTTREVVSRNLKAMERQGFVRLGLRFLAIKDAKGLSELAAQGPR